VKTSSFTDSIITFSGKSILCFALIFMLVFSTVVPLYAVPNDDELDQSTRSSGSITTDFAPELEIEVRPGPSAAETEQAQILLENATPEQHEELMNFYNQLDAIDRETEVVVEEYNAARVRLQYILTDITESEQDIEVLEQAFYAQSERLSERAVEIYREGSPNVVLYLIFQSESFQEMINKISLLNHLVDTDAELMARLRQQRSELELALQQLAVDEGEAASLEFELRARVIEVTARNEERKQELRDQNAPMIALFEAEQLQRMADEQELAFSIADGTNRNITVVPGSPVETAMALRGIPYLWGGATRRGFDCSGLMRFIFLQHGVNLPHHSASQALHGRQVTGPLQPGDLVFFGTPIHHVGMYVGGGYFIHSPRTGEVVSLRSLAARNDMVTARRLDWQPREGAPR